MDLNDISLPARLVLAAVACAFVAVMVGAPQSRAARPAASPGPRLQRRWRSPSSNNGYPRK